MQYVFDGKQIRARINQAYLDLLVCAERSFEFQKLQIKLAKLGDSKALLTPNPYAEDFNKILHIVFDLHRLPDDAEQYILDSKEFININYIRHGNVEDLFSDFIQTVEELSAG